MADYTYRHDDSLAAFDGGFTSRIGDGDGDTEEVLLAAIRTAAVCRAGGRFLDIGTGFGRIVGMLRPYAGFLVGVEPDRARFDYCRNHNQQFRHVRILNTTSSRLPRGRGDRFDLIVVSMVLQHVSTGACRGILDDVRALLRPGGVALVAVTHFNEQRFTCQTRRSPLDRDAFDRYAEQSDRHDAGLPVRLFDRAAFEAELAAAGLRVQVWQQFYYARPGMRDLLAEFYDVPAADLENLGLSQYALVTTGDVVSRAPLRRIGRWLYRHRRR